MGDGVQPPGFSAPFHSYWGETYGIGDPKEGELCYLNDNLCPPGVCGACMLKGGVTAGD